MKEYTITLYVERNDQEIELEIIGTVSPFVPGRYYGPPEKCFPDEGGDVELLAVRDVDAGGEIWDDELTAKEQEAAEELLSEASQDDDSEDDYEDDDDEL